ncbi:hypothetical protein ACQUSR_12640 [Streptomyces sp. P1-3]|uniref:hypothetical protein n=1 Tax=Streptomyces sp. P1-3 TaxID=3421658 RepID=UPI003D35F258
MAARPGLGWHRSGPDEAGRRPGSGLTSRLRAKMPPVPDRTPPRRAPRLMECAVCRAPGRAEALPGGVCRECRGEVAGPYPTPGGPAAVDVRRYAAGIRAGMRGRPKELLKELPKELPGPHRPEGRRRSATVQTV